MIATKIKKENPLTLARGLVTGINGSPKDAFDVTGKALKLLEKVPSNSRGNQLAKEILGDLRNSLRKFYSDPSVMYAAAEQVELVNSAIRAREQRYFLVH